MHTTFLLTSCLRLCIMAAALNWFEASPLRTRSIASNALKYGLLLVPDASNLLVEPDHRIAPSELYTSQSCLELGVRVVRRQVRNNSSP